MGVGSHLIRRPKRSSGAAAGARREGGTRDRILKTTGRILRASGYSQLTIERVAEESGVAKTTVYRHWPTKAALCMELYLDIAGRELNVPDTGDIVGDLRHITNTVILLQTQTVAGPALFGLLAEALMKPESRKDLLAEFAERRRQITRSVLKRAIERGQILPDTDVDLFIDALGGAVTFRLLQEHAPLTADFTDSLIRLLLHGCTAREAR
jgi:AcrR family transcriptional regulator